MDKRICRLINQSTIAFEFDTEPFRTRSVPPVVLGQVDRQGVRTGRAARRNERPAAELPARGVVTRRGRTWLAGRCGLRRYAPRVEGSSVWQAWQSSSRSPPAVRGTQLSDQRTAPGCRCPGAVVVKRAARSRSRPPEEVATGRIARSPLRSIDPSAGADLRWPRAVGCKGCVSPKRPNRSFTLAGHGRAPFVLS